jgi:hypothetical protein
MRTYLLYGNHFKFSNKLRVGRIKMWFSKKEDEEEEN